MRASNSGLFLKTAPPQIVLSAKQKNSTDKMYFTFQNGASFNYEADKDAYKLFSEVDGIPHLYHHNAQDSVGFSISSLDNNLAEYHIPLYYKNNQSGNVTISLNSFTIANNWSVWLEDLLNGETVDLKQSDYNFQHDKNNLNNRFVLNLSNPDGIIENDINSQKPVVWVDGTFINIKSKNNEAMKEIIILNASGQVLFRVTDLNGNTHQIPRYKLNVANGVVFVQMRGSRHTFIEKVLLIE